MAREINQYNPETVLHPCVTLIEKLEELEMGNKEFAIRVGKPEKTITALTNCSSSITPEMAVRFESVLNIPASFWLNKQRRYDEYLARKKRQKEIQAGFEWTELFPYSQMASLGWVAKTRNIEEQVTELFNFFGVANHYAWEAYYYKKELKICFSITLADTNEAGSISAWLRKGELEAGKIASSGCKVNEVKSVLVEIKSLMDSSNLDFFEQLQEICRKVGVKVVRVPQLPNVSIYGVSRWLGNNPIIQLPAKCKSIDRFWLAFFRGLGHILLHGKKYISIENIEHDGKDLKKEKEADDFARKMMGNVSRNYKSKAVLF